MCKSKPGHSSFRHAQVEDKGKKPGVSDFSRNTGVWCNSKFKLPKFKDFLIKTTEKVLQDEWMYSNECNCKTLKLQ